VFLPKSLALLVFLHKSVYLRVFLQHIIQSEDGETSPTKTNTAFLSVSKTNVYFYFALFYFHSSRVAKQIATQQGNISSNGLATIQFRLLIISTITIF